MIVQTGVNLQKVTSVRSVTQYVPLLLSFHQPFDLSSSLVILSVTVLQEMQSVIQVVVSRDKDMSAEHVDQKLIILKIVWSQIRDPQVVIDMETVGLDMVPQRRLDVSTCLNDQFPPRMLIFVIVIADECWFCLSNPNLAYMFLSFVVSSR